MGQGSAKQFDFLAKRLRKIAVHRMNGHPIAQLAATVSQQVVQQLVHAHAAVDDPLGLLGQSWVLQPTGQSVRREHDRCQRTSEIMPERCQEDLPPGFDLGRELSKGFGHRLFDGLIETKDVIDR
ncbi:hypothetical protein A7X84_01875 [Stenotrophomonas maltophilia]|nr:hypothetical protein A7X84_01875 [Stenotrophomonas maltophilia]PZT13962.1 hypothetical protein A7X82_13290 [Stenotrophomonas maltophilia]